MATGNGTASSAALRIAAAICSRGSSDGVMTGPCDGERDSLTPRKQRKSGRRDREAS
jgi:hypothetical protein